MKASTFFRFAPMLAAAVLAAAPVQAQEAPRIAAVSLDRITRESNQAKAAQVKLDGEFSPRDKELQAQGKALKASIERFEKSAASLSDAERAKRQRELAEQDRDFQRKQREFRDDLNRRGNEELAQVLERANRVIRTLADQRQYDLIVQEAVFVSTRIDITDDVIKGMNAGQ